jgi:hypothetical protein
VGKDQKRFVVHEQLLTHYSEFFRAALTGRFKEVEDKVVKLEDTRPRVFECFVHWLYHQRFPDASKGDDKELVQDWGTTNEDSILTTNLIEMYVLGDQRVMAQLQREALDDLYHHLMWTNASTPNDVQVRYAFKYLRSDDPLCRLLVDLSFYYTDFCPDRPGPYEPSSGHDWPVEYLLAFAHRTTEIVHGFWRRAVIEDFKPVLCDYHGHKTVKERDSCTQEHKGSECECLES